MADERPEQRLEQAGIILPQPPSAVASYAPAVLDGDLLLISGQLPFREAGIERTGLVGDAVTLEEAQQDASVAAVNALAVAKRELAELSRVRRVLRLVCYVAATPDFTGHPKVANGASEVMTLAFGDNGRHARAAVGCASLPLGAAVEVELMLRVQL